MKTNSKFEYLNYKNVYFSNFLATDSHGLKLDKILSLIERKERKS